MGHDARQYGVPLFPAPDETVRPPPPGRGPPPESTFARGAAAPRPRGGGLMAHRGGRVAGAGRGPPPIRRHRPQPPLRGPPLRGAGPLFGA